MKPTARPPLEMLRSLAALLVVSVLAACSTGAKVPASQKDPFYLYQMGVNHFQQGHLPEAERFFKDSLRYDPKNAATHNSLGLALLLQGRPADAVTSFRRAIELNSAFADAHNNLGVTYLQQGELAKAEAELNLARQDTVYNQGPSVWFNLGLVEALKGNHGEAVALFGEALARNKEYAIAHLHRARAREQIGQAEAALEDYRAYSEFRKDDPEALIGLAHCLLNLKRTDEARPLLERVRLLAPSSAEGQEAARLLAILP